MTTAITEYSVTEAALSKLKEQYGATVWVVDTPDRMTNAKRARAEIRKWRTDLEAERKRIKKPALDRCRDIDTEAKRITAELLALEDPVDQAIKDVELAKRREEERRAREEEQRIEGYKFEIENIRGIPFAMVGHSPSQIEEAANKLKGQDVSHMDFLSGEADLAKAESIEKLRSMYVDAKAQEEEAERLAKERAELEESKRKHAEEEAAARLARDKADQEARELRARQEADARKAREKEEARLRAEREKEENARRVREEAERKEREVKEAAERKVREKEEAKKRAERDKQEAAERRKEEAKRKAQAEKDEKARLLRIEKEKLLDARNLLSHFVETYGSIEEFSDVVRAINDYMGTNADETAP
jgi:chemotaxis protein histidine kinase CheA